MTTFYITKQVAIHKLLREFISANISVDYDSIEQSITVSGGDTVLANAIYTAHDPNPSPTELAAIARKANARPNAKAIPDWVSWGETEALAWGNTNIETPLATARTSLGVMSTLTLATFKTAMTLVLNILDKMWILQKSNMQMTMALRDETWPSLQDEQEMR